MFEMFLSIIAALSLLALGIYAVVKKRTAANVILLVVVALLAGIEVLDQLSLQPSIDFTLVRRISLSLESLLPASFLLLSLFYGRSRPFEALSKVRLVLAAALALFPVAMLFIAGNDLYYAPDFPGERVLFLDSAGYWYYLGVMASFILSLVNVEATLAATRGLDRHRMKFEVFGIMSLLAVLIFYYSQGLLYRTIDMDLVPVRSSVFIIAAILMGYSRIFRGNGTPVSISRHVLYRSIALLVVGIYLITLGLIGEGMRYFGDTFERDLGIVLAFAGGVFLLAVLFSEKLRRRIKVFIQKHFYAGKHDYREEWTKFTTRLSSCGTLSDVQEAVLTVYRETFGVAGASLYLLTKDEERYVRTLDHAMPDAPVELRISDEMQAYFVNRERVLDLNDGECRLSAPEQAILRQAGVWMIVPLISNGAIVGLTVLREQIVPAKLMYDDYDLMKVLARQAAQAVTNLRLSEELVETRAMAAVARISSFVIHDLKNLTTGLSLVVDNAEEHMGNPDFQKDAVLTIRTTLAKMKGLMQRLRSIPEKSSLTAGVEDIDRLSREIVTELAKMRPGTRIEYDGSPVLSRVDGEEIRKVIVNLVQNALEAGGEQGTVMVRTGKENGGVCIRVSDTGCGMTEDFVKDHLFKPFRTTKEKGLGIGLYQCKQIVEAHGGTIEVRSEVGKGTEFAVFLPAADADQ
jgi:putative PEP-CTERM system histidine kinase